MYYDYLFKTTKYRLMEFLDLDALDVYIIKYQVMDNGKYHARNV